MKKFTMNSVLGSLALSVAFGLSGPLSVLAAGPAPVDLLSASTFAIVSKAGITDTGSHSSVILGSIGTSPITAAAMNSVFCSELVGGMYGVDAGYVGSGDVSCFHSGVMPANKTYIDQAVLDIGTAYTDAAGRPTPDGVDLFAGNLGGQTLAPGLYKWNTNVTIPTNVTLSGGANDVWIMQISGNLDIASAGSVPAGIKVVLTGGAQASNVFWQVGGVTGATLGTYSTFNGTILAAKQIIMQTGAVLNGRALAQTQVTLDANPLSAPGAPAVIVPPPVATGGGSSGSSSGRTPQQTNGGSSVTTVTTTAAPTVLPGDMMITFATPFAPAFPNTGLPPRENKTSGLEVALLGIIAAAAVSLCIALRKRAV